MDAGDIAEGLFEISIGILCIVLSFFRKNDQSEDAKFIRKYNKQLLLVFGMLALIRGTQVFIDERKSEPELTSEENAYSFNSNANYDLNDTNNPIYVMTVLQQGTPPVPALITNETQIKENSQPVK